MATIRTSCPGCGEVDLSPDSVLVNVRTDTGEGSYRFVCPKCMEPVEKRADRRIVALLKSVGVGIMEAGPDDEWEQATAEPAVPHPESLPGGDPFTADDLINFHFMLEDDEQLAQFLTSLQN
ncbi:MAG TPA: hypothetical protein VGH10_04970 [Actinomycetota bacterium]|jgi:hypothetical protein